VHGGANHVFSLTIALSCLLTGKSSARIVFAKLTTGQIRKYFGIHQSYVCSLRMIQISSGITALDVPRVERMADVSTIERTTCEMALQLTLADGVINARCNIVNGSSDQKVYLLAPQPHYNEVQAAFKAYRLRLNLLSKRETRFRDSLPDLPSVIYVDVSTQANLAFVEHLTSEDMSRRAPTLVRGVSNNNTTHPPAAVFCPPPSSTTSSMDGDSFNDPPLRPPLDIPGDGKLPAKPSSKQSKDRSCLRKSSIRQPNRRFASIRHQHRDHHSSSCTHSECGEGSTRLPKGAQTTGDQYCIESRRS
jgi:hypothetical protein